MAPALILVLLLAGLVALVPVWRLHTARWPTSWLVAAWIMYAVTILAAMRFGPASRFIIPILVVAYLAPFVTVRDGLARLLGAPRRRPPDAPSRRPPPKNVTPPDAGAGPGR